MKNKSLIYLFVLLTVIFLSSCKNAAPEVQEEGLFTLYYTNEDWATLGEFQVPLLMEGMEPFEKINRVLHDLQLFPEDANLEDTAISVIPEGVSLSFALREDVGGTTLRLYVDGGYDDLSPNQEVILRIGVCQALFAVGDIARIEVYGVDVKENRLVAAVRADDTVLVNQYDNHRYEDEAVCTLYFVDRASGLLVPEVRKLSLHVADKLQEVVVNALIDGPREEGHVRLLSGTTRVHSVWIKDATCYVDFNQEFLSRYVGTEEEERLIVYSVVDTLCELPGIESVQFLVDGERVDYYDSAVSIYGPLSAQEDLIQKQQ